ncbi:P-loop domain-containing protein [Lacrimispora sphenoides]|uniref:P-loop domain-containing protein n=1 Tax=Lacrimispora sphenoides TaxID=29370 RepID=UPI001A9A69C5|nr:P-loop domain-containing protein [Lacrimispora sphenoides]
MNLTAKGCVPHSLSKQNKTQSVIFLREENYCAFIANGSILAREKGTELPMKAALPFQSTIEDEIEIVGVRGMGVRRGITVITGGGYSGKSTVLNAISAGIYNHAAGDGRELCITVNSAVTITAEDGRAVSSLNISPFIKWIPNGDTQIFSTANASGSTSQAANIMEAIECGSTLLLIDEDRSATNFMIRDTLMKKLIEKEPITPFTDRVRELSTNGVSTILVIGGSGEYLSVADKIYIMDDFVINDATSRAKSISPAPSEPPSIADWTTRRILINNRFTSYPEGSGSERLEVSDTGFIVIGDECIDVRALHDIATTAQVDALAFMLRFLQRGADDGNELEILARAMRGLTCNMTTHEIDVAEHVGKLYAQIEQEGINIVDTVFFIAMNRFLDLPREFELRAAINRMRCTTFSVTRKIN